MRAAWGAVSHSRLAPFHARSPPREQPERISAFDAGGPSRSYDRMNPSTSALSLGLRSDLAARKLAHHFRTAGGITDVHRVVQIALRVTVSLLSDLRPLETGRNALVRSGIWRETIH